MKKKVGRYKGYRIVAGSKNLIGKKEGFIDKKTGKLLVRKGDSFIDINSGELCTYNITDKVFKFLNEHPEEKLELLSTYDTISASFTSTMHVYFEEDFIKILQEEDMIIDHFVFQDKNWKFDSNPDSFINSGIYNLSKGSKGIYMQKASIDSKTSVVFKSILSTSENSIDPKYWVSVDINIKKDK